MTNINWRVRLANKTFWLSAIPALALLMQAILQVFGISYDFGALVDHLLVVVNAAFAFLVILGLVNDPTTKGLSDSDQAMNYTVPKGE